MVGQKLAHLDRCVGILEMIRVRKENILDKVGVAPVVDKMKEARLYYCAVRCIQQSTSK